MGRLKTRGVTATREFHFYKEEVHKSQEIVNLQSC